MPYATDNKISKKPIEGGIEITEEEYKDAMQEQMRGKAIAVRDEELRILSREKKTVWSVEDKSTKDIPENEDIPDGYTDEEPGEHDYWDGNRWVEDTEEKKNQDRIGRIEEIDERFEEIDNDSMRAVRSKMLGKDTSDDHTRLRELNEEAEDLREERRELEDQLNN